MTSQLALIGCIFFIFFIFINDLKDKPNVSYTHFIPLAWILYCAFSGIGRWFMDPSSLIEDIKEGNPIDRPILTILMVLGLTVLIKRRIDWAGVLKHNRLIFIFFIYMAISILWSDFPSVSIKRWLRTMGDVLMVLVTLTESVPLEGIKKLIRRCAFITIPLSILFIKYFRHLGITYTLDGEMTMWVGVTSHKNELGALALVCGIFFIWDIIFNRQNRKTLYVDIILLTICLWLINGSSTASSKTSLLLFIWGSCLLIFLYSLRKKPKLVLRVLWGFVIVYIFLNVLAEGLANVSLYDLIVKSSGRDPTLTGRTDLWKELIAIASEKPLLGRGFGSFWLGNVRNLWDKFIWRPTQAHNGYIDVYLELGLVGVALLASAILCAYKSIINTLHNDFRYGSLRIAFFLIILIHNYSESSFLRGTSLPWFIFLLFALNPPQKVNNKAITPMKYSLTTTN
jgi:exopolysaccharide production protein ExoQ